PPRRRPLHQGPDRLAARAAPAAAGSPLRGEIPGIFRRDMSDAPKRPSTPDPRAGLDKRERLAGSFAGPTQLAKDDAGLQLADKQAAAAVARLHDNGRQTAHERIDLLLDEGSFVELDKFVTSQCPDFDMP